MKTKLLALLLICACLLSVFCVYAGALPPPKEIDDGCNTKEELRDFLKENTGGTITLTGDILWDYTDNMPMLTQSTVVEMGTHKIIIPADRAMQIQGPVTFRGAGAVLFETAGLLNLSYGVEVCAYGADAVAIHGAQTADLQLFICNIAATGDNSTAIRSANPVTVQLCRVSGTRSAIEAPQITLDASAVSPASPAATVIRRVPTLERSLRLYGITLPAEVSEDAYTQAIYGYGDLQYAFIDPESGNAIGGPLPCAWSNVPTFPPKAGDYTLTVRPANLPDWFPIEIPSFEIPLHIVDKDTLWMNVGYADPYFGMLALQFAPNMPGDAAQVTLFCSTDEGQTWKNATEVFPDSTVRADFMDIVGLAPNTNYWFYAEVSDGTRTVRSNILYHPNFHNHLNVDYSHGGGDRDEDDFGDQGETLPPAELIPPPDTNSSTDAGLWASSSPASTTKPIEQPSSCEPTASVNTETASHINGSTQTVQTDVTTSVSESGTDKSPQDDAHSYTAGIVVFLLGIIVVVGIVWRKGGRR